jgi:hypothetical protein
MLLKSLLARLARESPNLYFGFRQKYPKSCRNSVKSKQKLLVRQLPWKFEGAGVRCNDARLPSIRDLTRRSRVVCDPDTGMKLIWAKLTPMVNPQNLPNADLTLFSYHPCEVNCQMSCPWCFGRYHGISKSFGLTARYQISCYRENREILDYFQPKMTPFQSRSMSRDHALCVWRFLSCCTSTNLIRTDFLIWKYLRVGLAQ